MIVQPKEIETLYSKYGELLGTPGMDILASVEHFPGYVAFAIEHGDTLVAFLDGFTLTDKVFRLLNVYNDRATRKEMLLLLQEFEAYVTEAGYVGWYSYVVPKHKRLVEKLGGKQWEPKQR